MGATISTELMTGDERRGRGRRFMSAERRRELVAAFGDSGLTRTEFARREGIRYTTLCNWVQREANAGVPAKTPGAVRFAEVTLPAGPGRGLEVRLPDGTLVRGGRAEEVATVVRALRA